MAKKVAATKTASPIKKKSAPKRKGAATKRKRAATRRQGREGVVVLRTAESEFELRCGPNMQRAAVNWNYIVRTRLRWRSSVDSRLELGERSQRLLNELGLDRNQLEHIAQSSLVEVCCRYVAEATDWEGRVVPWEHLLNAATRELRGENALTVVRHLDCGGARVSGSKEDRLAVICSASEPILEYYDFTHECELPSRRLLNAASNHPAVKRLDSPTLEEIGPVLASHRPMLIHVAGVDSHEAAELLGWPDNASRFDGMLLRDSNWQLVEKSAEQVAKAIGPVGSELVVYNFYRSGPRIAALTVAEGARAAIGFQDTVDNAVAEQFFSDLYSAWKFTDRNTHAAFLAAMRLLRDASVELRGSGIVLWADESIFAAGGEKNIAQGDQGRLTVLKNRGKPLLPDDVPSPEFPTAADVIQVEIEPRGRINYSLLHNRRPLFKRFRVVKNVENRIPDIRVETSLQTGLTGVGCQLARELTQSPTDLSQHLSLPLTWLKDGGFPENVRTNLHVRVQWGQHVLYDGAHVVTLTPANEWEDTDENRQYLPSFVFPRDPAVYKVIQSAQHFLIGLADNAGAGFDGYQSVAWTNEDPTEGVDRQAWAIWSALVHDVRLNYINPPPSYNLQSQRLRMPSEILREGRGTCIDLALLLAACFEYIDVFPVIFLLQGHAFPGYWRSEEAHDEFTCVYASLDEGLNDEQGLNVSQSNAWLLAGESAHREVLKYVQHGDLVPLESVWLTQHLGFWEAIEAGWENLRNVDEFDSMLDVRRARDCDVTPLPIGGAS